ncbi:unnamed protein product [Protopolystoma xenopodis]|uniref:Uncharacterized protein n=1 Tax=Protopolystoma xenopodis TaxID=117903 RepID=A0A3S4ZMJ2_9PLAT|nr:unnamed protein product [Protopolystoma xenopodis]
MLRPWKVATLFSPTACSLSPSCCQLSRSLTPSPAVHLPLPPQNTFGRSAVPSEVGSASDQPVFSHQTRRTRTSDH